MALEKPIIPTFSLKERDRRWSLLRAAMKKANFDALIALPHEGHWDQFGCDTRYITQIGGTQTEVGCVLPLEADVTAVVRGENEIEWWGLAQDWVKDIRPSRRSYGEPVIDRLKEVRAERVGVIALSGMVRAPEGVVPWGTFEKIRTALPNVKFANATDVMQEVRSVKSAEEVAFIEKAAEIIGHANEVLIQHAKVGVGENELIAEMLREVVRRGGEPITMMLFGTGGPEVPWAQRVFTTRKLKPGDLINTEVEGKYAGYIAQALQPISLGPKPKDLEKIFDATKVIFDRMLQILETGHHLRRSRKVLPRRSRRRRLRARRRAHARPRPRRRRADALGRAQRFPRERSAVKRRPCVHLEARLQARLHARLDPRRRHRGDRSERREAVGQTRIDIRLGVIRFLGDLETVSQLSFRGEAEESLSRMWV